MLGNSINDLLGSEGEKGTSQGFGLLDIDTQLFKEKQLHNREGRLTFDEVQVSGYEIHTGLSEGEACQRAFIRYESKGEVFSDGAMSKCHTIAGTYWHGLFESSNALQAILQWAGLQSNQTPDFSLIREQQINRLADAVEANMDLDQVLDLLDIDLQGKCSV